MNIEEKSFYNWHRSMIGVSHGGGLTSHGTDAESFPSEQDTDQLGQSVAVHGTDEGYYDFSSLIDHLYRI